MNLKIKRTIGLLLCLILISWFLQSSFATSDITREIYIRVNNERDKFDQQKLVIDAELTKAAEIRAKEIIELFDHTRPNGQECFTIVDELNITYYLLGENILMGQYVSASKAVDLWMESKPHRESILNPAFTHTGIGCYEDSSGNKYFVQLFMKKQ